MYYSTTTGWKILRIPPHTIAVSGYWNAIPVACEFVVTDGEVVDTVGEVRSGSGESMAGEAATIATQSGMSP